MQYLHYTRTEGLILDPKRDEFLEVFADAGFLGNLWRSTSMDDPSTEKSRTGYYIMYAGYLIIWASKLQTIVALLSCEAYYISLSQSLRETIPLMSMIDEIKVRGFKAYSIVPVVYFKYFEDNSGTLELARVSKQRPRSKHINTTYHQFREHVRKGIIRVFPIGTADQLTDTYTKARYQNLFLRNR